MPPTPGIFYGQGPTHGQGVITTTITRPSSAAANYVVGPGVPGSGARSRLGGGQLNTFPPSDRDRDRVNVVGMDGGMMMNGQEMYGPGIGHGLHSQHQHPQSHMLNGHNNLQQQQQHQPVAGPSSRHAASGTMEDSLSRKEKRKKESFKLGKETSDRRDDGRHYTESVSALHNTALILSTRPEVSAHFQLRLYPLSLERSALIAQLESEERYAIDCAQVAYDEERERVEDEWKRGREKVKERLLEGIEERRKRAREEKEGEGTVGDASLDSHSRPPITRKLRNKLGTSPPPTPHNGANGLPALHHLGASISSTSLAAAAANLPITTGPFLNPHSLSVDDLPSPFPMPLTSTNGSHSAGGASASAAAAGASGLGGTGTGPNSGRRRVKGGGGHQGQAVGGLGKSLLVLTVSKDMDVENDLNEIRRGNKRRRVVAGAGMKT